MDFPPSSENLLAILGFQPSLGRGTTDNYQQVQHFSTAGSCGRDHRYAFVGRRLWTLFDRLAVSKPLVLFSLFLYLADNYAFFPLDISLLLRPCGVD